MDKTTSIGNMESSLFTTLPRTLQEIHESFGHASISLLDSFIPKTISFEKIHLDLIGPIDPQSQEQRRFILTLVDNYMGYLAGFPLVKKDVTCDVLIKLLKNKQKRCGSTLRGVELGGEIDNYTTNDLS
ncbi:hypothetical protein VP01_4057g1 [Puccinia sorghi]|uniref:Integrase catalytic domain-containing protein n=1 Tax=Puccinia sorghi TaxID=27349 RepID=A0A0L6USF8_9BASI|nr:hypothetical protein VP01_4057g1 [Puccinia sorghi]